MRVLAIAGSLRKGSFNRMLVQEAARLAPDGVEVTEWGELADVPPFDEDVEGQGAPSVTSLLAAIADADAVLVATPEYNGSTPGQLKNALDWASRPFPDNVLRDKPAAVIGTSPSPAGAERSQGETRAVLRRIGAQVLDRAAPLPTAHERFDDDGRLQDDEAHAEVRAVLDELVGLVEKNRAAV